MPDLSHAPVPSVSVVMPTLGRPTLLLTRALRSALDQTLRDTEIIVVIDGPDPATERALATVDDPRLRVIALAQHHGGAEARNVGVRAARAGWIALLDDDDEWLPHKLEKQLALARVTPGRPIVACHWITRTPRGDYANPARLPDPHEPLGDYMLARRTPLEQTCGLISNLLMTSRELLLDVPFTPGLPQHQDWDWLLRASALPGVRVVLIPETAAIWYYEEERPSVSTQRDWRRSLAWAQQHLKRGSMSRRAFTGFVISHVVPAAQQSPERFAALSLFLPLLMARPRPFEWILFVGNAVMPTELRRGARARLDSLLRDVQTRRDSRHSRPVRP